MAPILVDESTLSYFGDDEPWCDNAAALGRQPDDLGCACAHAGSAAARSGVVRPDLWISARLWTTDLASLRACATRSPHLVRRNSRDSFGPGWFASAGTAG